MLRSSSLYTHADATLPRRNRWVLLSLLPHATAAFPEILTGRLPHFGLSRPARRSLAFRPACSRNRPRRSLSSEASTASLPPPPLQWLPAGATRRRLGLTPTGKRRLCTAHSILTIRCPPIGLPLRLALCQSATAHLFFIASGRDMLIIECEAERSEPRFHVFQPIFDDHNVGVVK